MVYASGCQSTACRQKNFRQDFWDRVIRPKPDIRINKNHCPVGFEPGVLDSARTTRYPVSRETPLFLMTANLLLWVMYILNRGGGGRWTFREYKKETKTLMGGEGLCVCHYTTRRNRHFAPAYLLGTTRLSFILLTELEPSIYVTDKSLKGVRLRWGYSLDVCHLQVVSHGTIGYMLSP